MIEITAEYLASQGLSPSFPRRFWSKVHKTDSCWLWTAACTHGGYGWISRTGTSRAENPKGIRAHIASWILHKGSVPEGLCVLHNCPGGDKPACVNFEHLWTGTHAENMADMVQKGRSRSLHGEDHPLHKLTREQVVEIRRLHSLGLTGVWLAKTFGITPANISNIILYRTWLDTNENRAKEY